MEEEIGLEEILLGDCIIGENIDLKKRITLRSNESTSIDGCVALSIQGDTRCDCHSTGHAYNSNSGCLHFGRQPLELCCCVGGVHAQALLQV
jgi:hypothetical protein